VPITKSPELGLDYQYFSEQDSIMTRTCKVIKRESVKRGGFKFICLWYSDGTQKVIGIEQNA
jgi:hypothetical protein